MRTAAVAVSVVALALALASPMQSRAQPSAAEVAGKPGAAGQGSSPSGEGWNGFDVSNASVPSDKILAGGPMRDSIRSVDQPELADAEAALDWVAPANTVIGLAVGEVAHAYPVHLLEYHQVVNDELAGVPVVVSYDPLTGLPRAFERKLAGRTLEFGVSGLVYQSSGLLYDRETESLWLPWTGEAIAGPMQGKRLARLRVRQEPFAAWMHRHPESLVLARPMLKQIDYRFSPYTSYWVSETIPFPVDSTDASYHSKEVVVGLRSGGKTRAYLGSVMLASGGRVIDDFAGQKIRIAYDTDTGTFTWEVPEDIEVTESYWFAWKAFEPETEVWHGIEVVSPAEPSTSPKQAEPQRAE